MISYCPKCGKIISLRNRQEKENCTDISVSCKHCNTNFVITIFHTVSPKADTNSVISRILFTLEPLRSK